MGMYYPPRRPDEIYHWGIEKGSESKNHKYFNRILTGVKNGQNIYRYFYDKAEWDAYKNNQSQQVRPQNAQNTVQQTQSTAQVAANNTGNVTGRTPSLLSRLLWGRVGSELIERGKEALASIIRTAKEVTDPEPEKPKEPTRPTETKVTPPEDLTEDVIEQRKAAADANGGIENPEGEAKYKYLARIPMGDGTFRYFYDKASLEAYYNATNDDLAKEFGLRTEDSTGEEDRVNINERYHDYSLYERYFENKGAEYTNNCYSCTTAYELRRRGYDVDAIPDPDGDSWDTVLSMYKNPTSKSYTESYDTADPQEFTKNMIKDMEAEGDGARGNLCVYWKGGGGHSLAWEVVDGEVQIIDNQTDDVYKGSEIANYLMSCVDTNRSNNSMWITQDKDGNYMLDEYHSDPKATRFYDTFDVDPVQWVRTDNCELNAEKIKKYVRKDY